MSVQDLERYLEEPISVLKRFLDQLPKDVQNKICNEALLPVLNSFINKKLGLIRLPDCACNSNPTAFKRLLQIAIDNLNENDLWKKLSPFDSFATTSVANSLASEDPFSKPIELVNTQSDRAHDLLVQLLQRLSSEHKREVALPLIKVAVNYYKEKHLSPNDSSSEVDAAAAAAQSKSQQQPHSIGKLTTQIESYQINGNRNENEWKHSSIEHISSIRNSSFRSSNQHQSSVNDSSIHENRETNLPVRSGISDSDRRDESSESSNGGMPGGGGKKTFQKLIEQHLISKRNLPAQQPVLPSSSTDGISGVSSSSKSIQDYRSPALPEARDAKINDHHSRNSMAHSSFKLSEYPYQRPNNSAEPKFEPSAISMYADRADRAANPRFDNYQNVQSQKQQQQQQQQNQQPSSLDIAKESATIKEACNFVIQCDDDWAKADASAPNLEDDFHSSGKPFDNNNDNAAQENIQPKQQQPQQSQQRQSRNSEHSTDMDTRSGGASGDEKSNHNIDFGRSAHRRSSSLRSTESDSYAHAIPPSEVSSSRNQLRESLNSYRRNAAEPGSPKSVLSGGGGSLASSNAQKIDESLRSSQATAAATSESRTPSESASQTSVPIHDSQQQQQQQPQQRQPPQRASNGHMSMVEAFKNRNSMMMADRNKNSLDGDNNYQNYNPNKQNNNLNNNQNNNRYNSNQSQQQLPPQQPGDHRNATWQSKPKIGSEHQAPESPPFDRSAIPDDFDWTS